MSRPSGNRKRRPGHYLPIREHTRRELMRQCPHCGHMLFLNGIQNHWPERCPARGMEAAR